MFLPLFGIIASASVLLLVAVRGPAEVVRIPVKPAGAGPLFQIHYGDKWGFMDRRGNTVIAPRFDSEGNFFGGLAKVELNQKWGYVDGSGHVAIPCRFDSVGDFSEGLAPVQVNRRWGYIDQHGKMVIEPRFQAAASYKDGLARFEVWDTVNCDPIRYNKGNQPEVYTKEDAPLYAFQLPEAAAVSMTLCFPPRALFGFVDRHGKIAIAPKFPEARDFSEQLAPVRLEQSSKPKWGYIDGAGRMVIEPQFHRARPFSGGLAGVEIGFRPENGQKVAGVSGFVRRDGRFAFPPNFEEVLDFSEGLAAVRTRGGAWGFVDERGTFVVRPRYETANRFSSGLSLVWPCGESENCYIDRTGKIALEITMKGYKWPFSDGLTVSGEPGKRKYVDRNGRTVAPYEVSPAP